MEEITLKEFALKVQEMRKAQKAFFSSKQEHLKDQRELALKRSKVLEREVDNMCLDLLEPLNQNQIDLPF